MIAFSGLASVTHYLSHLCNSLPKENITVILPEYSDEAGFPENVNLIKYDFPKQLFEAALKIFSKKKFKEIINSAVKAASERSNRLSK